MQYKPSNRIQKLCNKYQVDERIIDFESLMQERKDYSSDTEFIEEVIAPQIKALSPLDKMQMYAIEKVNAKNEEEKGQECITLQQQGLIGDHRERLLSLFNEPKIIGIISDADEGKSNLAYYLIQELRKDREFDLFTYGLRKDVQGAIKINSIPELEQIRGSVVILDEYPNLIDLQNRKMAYEMEKTIRMIYHNNNILVLIGVGNNFKKFVSGCIDVMMFKKTTIADLINGSRVKNAVLNYQGNERGSAVLNIAKDDVLVYDGLHYVKLSVPYVEEFDTKKSNKPIFVQKCADYVEK